MNIIFSITSMLFSLVSLLGLYLLITGYTRRDNFNKQGGCTMFVISIISGFALYLIHILK